MNMSARALTLVFVFAACGGGAKHERPPAQAAHREPSHGEPMHGEHSHGHHGQMPHRFENAEQWAKVFDDPKRDAWQQPDRVIEALALAPDLVVADVGAGTGYFAVRIAPFVKEVIATDVEADMVRYMKERAEREGIKNLRSVLTPHDDPQLPPVDRILVVDVWHHLGDRVAYAKKLAAALKPGGFVAVVDFKLDATMGPPKKHRLAPDAIIADLRAAGLDAKLSTVALEQQYVVIARR